MLCASRERGARHHLASFPDARRDVSYAGARLFRFLYRIEPRSSRNLSGLGRMDGVTRRVPFA